MPGDPEQEGQTGVQKDQERTQRILEQELEFRASHGDVEGLTFGFVEAMLNGVQVDQSRFFDLTTEAYSQRATANRREVGDLQDPIFKDNPLAKHLERKAMDSAGMDDTNARRYQEKKRWLSQSKSGPQ